MFAPPTGPSLLEKLSLMALMPLPVTETHGPVHEGRGENSHRLWDVTSFRNHVLLLGLRGREVPDSF